MAFALAAGAHRQVPAAAPGRLFLARLGALRLLVGDSLWVLGPGNLVLLGAHMPAVIQASSMKCVVHVAHLPLRDSEWRRVKASRAVATDLVRALLGELVQVPTGLRSARVRRIARLLQEEIQLEQTPPPQLPRPADYRLQRVCNAVLNEPAKAWSAQDLARVAGTSTRTLARRFMQQLGTTPADWCRAARMATALSEIARGGTLHDAAAASGFSAPSSMCAAFKKVTGTTFMRYFRGGPHVAADEVAFFS
jgi:AraC-like DNA-binding protein